MPSWRPEFKLDGINSGSWYHCLAISNLIIDNLASVTSRLVLVPARPGNPGQSRGL